MKKMDTYTISKQKWEIQYVASKFNIKPEKVRQVMKEAKTKSRKKIYNLLRQL